MRYAVVVVLLAASLSPAWGAACPEIAERLRQDLEPTGRLGQRLKALEIDLLKTPVALLTYTHVPDPKPWKAFEASILTRRDANGNVLKEVSVSELGIEITDGVPQVPLRAGQPLFLAVVDTNPLLFSIEQKAVERVNIAALETIQTIALGFGQAIRLPFSETYNMKIYGVPNPKVPGFPRPDPVEELKAAVDRAGTHAGVIKRDVQTFIRQVQLAERGVHPGVMTLPAADLVEKTATVFQTLQDKAAAVPSHPGVCAAVLVRAEELLKLEDKKLTVAQWRRELGRATDDIEQVSCATEQNQQKASIVAVVEQIDPARPRFEGLYSDVRDLRRAQSEAGEIDALKKSARDLIDKYTEVLTAASSLDAFRLRASTFAGDVPCNVMHGILYVEQPPITTTWSKIAKSGLTVQAAPPLGGAFVLRRPEKVDRTVHAVSRTGSLLGVGVGPIYTDIANPKWAAGTDPTNSARKVIQRVDENSRSGDLAVLASIRIPSLFKRETAKWPIRPGIQFGVGAGGDLALFGGLSFDIFKYVRLGGGYTYQRVKELAGEQREFNLLADGAADPRSIVATTEDIKTRDAGASSWYASLLISIDELPFWKKE